MEKQSLAEIENWIEQEALKLARTILRHRFAVDPRADPDREYKCALCQGKLRIQEGQQQRRLETTLGEVEYRRPYGTCDRCGVSYAPMDSGLGIPPTGGSVTRTERVCHAAVNARSFEAAAEILSEHAGIELSAKQVRVISESEGKKAASERRQEVAAFRSGAVIDGPVQAPELIVVVADGGRIQTRQSGSAEEGGPSMNTARPDEEAKGGVWKEDKVGAVYEATPRKDTAARDAEKYEGARARVKTFAASLESWEEFGWMLCVEAMKRGYGRAREKLFISDGAQSLRTLRQYHFPDAVFILDWFHAVEHLADCAKAAFGEATEEYSRWYKRIKAKLWAGDLNAVISAIEKESARLGKPQTKEHESSPRVILHRNIGYFRDNRDGMDYPRFRAEGWPIGSGVAEGAVKQFGMRLKGTEKFWNGFGCGLGAEEMLALSALHRSEDGRWRTYWERRSQPYIRQPRA